MPPHPQPRYLLGAALCGLLLACNAPAPDAGLDAADRMVARGELEGARRLYSAALAGGDEVRALKGLGLLEQYRWRWPESRALLERALPLAPDDPVVRVALAMALVATQEPVAAREHARYLIEHHAALGSGQLLLALVADTPETATEALQALRTLAQQPDANSAEVQLSIADLQMRLGEARAARSATHAAQTRSLADVSSALRLSFLYGRLERFEPARALLEAVVHSRADRLDAWHQLAQVAIEQGDATRATQALQQIPAAQRHEPRFDALRGRVLLATQNSVAALPLLMRAVQAMDATARDSDDGVQLRVWLAQARGGAGELPTAASELQQLIALPTAPASAWLTLVDVQLRMRDEPAALETLSRMQARPELLVPALEALGRLHMDAGRPAAACDAFARLRSAAPKSDEAAFLHGKALQAAGRGPEAVSAFESVLRLQPTRLAALVLALSIHDAAGRSAEASALLTEQLQRLPNSAALYVLAGDRQRAAGRRREAEAAYQKALQLDETHVEGWVRLAQLASDDAEPVRALSLYEQALRHEANHPQALLSAGTLHVQLAQFAEAEGMFEMLLHARPDSATALNNLAYLRSRHPEQLAQAETLARRARELDEASPHTADTLGWILHLKGEHDAALPLLREALAALPQQPLVRFHLGTALLAAGHSREGRAELQRALRLAADFVGADEARRALAGR